MFAIRVRGAEDTFRLEYALRVMAQSAMPKVTHELLLASNQVCRGK